MSKNEQLELAYNFVQYTNRNIFLTGKAGTGKTTFLHNLKKTTLKRMAVVAPTGVAAINAGGVTIHSLFQMPFGPYLAESVTGVVNQQNHQKKFNREKINLIQSLDLLVIDEVSMVRADLLDGIDEVLRKYKNRHKPFGGVQLLMIGDLHQLSPVVKDDDWKLLRDYYPNLYFFSSKSLRQSAPVSIELKHIYRQSDSHFIDLLNHIRENSLDSDILNRLNSRHIPNFTPDENEGYITLTTHNRTAQEINDARLAQLTGKSRIFMASINDDFPEYNYPTTPELELKVGAQVMFVKNDTSQDHLYYNGKIGKVTRMESNVIYVKCPDSYVEIAVTKAEWKNIRYDLNNETKEIQETEIGSYIQFPLKLAWAITIHKSQGLTFEKAIIDAGSSFAHGQVYVALSRCKSFEGIVLRSPLSLWSVKTDHTVSGFVREADQNAPGEKQLEESKTLFQQSLLFELFDFKTIKTNFAYCLKLTHEHDHILPPLVTDSFSEIAHSSEKTIYGVADTFARELHKLLAAGNTPEENAELQERVKKACAYFSAKVDALLYQAIEKIAVETDNKTAKKSINDAVDRFKKEVFVKLTSLNKCVEGFDTLTYLKTKANAAIDYNNQQKSPPEPRIKAPANINHPELYAQIKKWRNALASENNVPVYIVLPEKAIQQLIELLPSSLLELETVKGIGKQKVKKYGREIIEMIYAYCSKHDIQQTPLNIPLPEIKAKPDTKKLSLDMFKEGKTANEIALERGLSPATVEGHLAHFISTGEIELYEIVPKDKADLISEYLTEYKPTTLIEAKTALGEEISYGEIRAVMKHLEFLEVEM